jgi:hypothetical protein
MTRRKRRHAFTACARRLLVRLVAAIGLVAASCAFAQIDPVRRDLVEFGYDQPLHGHFPLAAYLFYYVNRPQFGDADHALRAAISPTYLDGDWATRNAFGPDTDFSLGIQGGAFDTDYNEIRDGRWLRDQSFNGYDGGFDANVYHLFNPTQRIPLYGVLRGAFRYIAFGRASETGANFVVPRDQPIASVRAGLRFGGAEPVLVPDKAAEISAWYDGSIRFAPGTYGYANDRRVERNVQRFLGRALLMYTLDDGRRFSVQAIGGASVHPDRIGAFRIGGTFTQTAEFPLPLPGYVEGELSARNFFLFAGDYSVPLSRSNTWSAGVGFGVARVDYTPGLEQPHAWNTGASLMLAYTPPTRAWRGQLVYGHGFDAIRDGHRGADVVSLLVEVDLERMGYVDGDDTRAGAPRTASR